tara:strand:+ start:563 stop:1981 length:1419 start_codon:yes stop_codon:yes gene_type:complete
MNSIIEASSSEIANGIVKKAFSSEEVVSAFITHADEYESSIGAFITRTTEQAIEEARKADSLLASGKSLGPLHGVPFGIKDIFWEKNSITTSGSALDTAFVPKEDATSVRLIKQSGGVVLGKTNTVELAFDPTGRNATYGMPNNPWKIDRMPGGSSSGTGAGIAAGFFPMGLGSDTGGSIRIPSSLCGISGIKPTFGLISRFGITPLSHSLDTAGPMARTVEDLAICLNVLAQHDPKDPFSRPHTTVDYTSSLHNGVKGFKIGVPKEYVWDPIDPETASSVSTAIKVLEDLGAEIVEVSIPELDWTPLIAVSITTAEAAMAHRNRVIEHGSEMDQSVRRRFESGMFISATTYAHAQRARLKYASALAKIYEKVDILAMPTVAAPAPVQQAEVLTLGNSNIAVRDAFLRLTRIFNLSRTPAISIPCGFSAEGLPIGLMLGSAAFEDSKALQAGQAYQSVTKWHLSMPKIQQAQ